MLISLRFILHVYENYLFLLMLITLSLGEVRLYFLQIDLKNQINLLETLLFCLLYICSTRSLLPLSPGTGFTYFLLTATQPQLCTQVNCSNWDCSNCYCLTLFGKYHLPDSKMSTAQNWLICLYTTRMAYGQNKLGCFGFW